MAAGTFRHGRAPVYKHRCLEECHWSPTRVFPVNVPAEEQLHWRILYSDPSGTGRVKASLLGAPARARDVGDRGYGSSRAWPSLLLSAMLTAGDAASSVYSFGTPLKLQLCVHRNVWNQYKSQRDDVRELPSVAAVHILNFP